MTNFTQETELLAPLQTFSQEAFVGDNNVPQDICNFVLALALIYNDCKDGIFSNLILGESKPSGESQLSRPSGAYSGFMVHYLRLHFSLIQELLNLIAKSQQTIKHPFFNSVIQQLSKQDRDSWAHLTQNPVGWNLALVKDQLAGTRGADPELTLTLPDSEAGIVLSGSLTLIASTATESRRTRSIAACGIITRTSQASGPVTKPIILPFSSHRP